MSPPHKQRDACVWSDDAKKCGPGIRSGPLNPADGEYKWQRCLPGYFLLLFSLRFRLYKLVVFETSLAIAR